MFPCNCSAILYWDPDSCRKNGSCDGGPNLGIAGFFCAAFPCATDPSWNGFGWFWMVFLASQEPTRVQPAIDFRFGFWKRVEGFLGTKTAKTESRDGCRCTSLTQNPGVSAIFLAMSTRQFGSLVNCQDLASKHSDFHGVTWKTEMPEDVTVQWFLNLTLW